MKHKRYTGRQGPDALQVAYIVFSLAVIVLATYGIFALIARG